MFYTFKDDLLTGLDANLWSRRPKIILLISLRMNECNYCVLNKTTMLTHKQLNCLSN